MICWGGVSVPGLTPDPDALADLAGLAATIRQRHGSVYRFAQSAGLPRSVVGQVLRGVYPGDLARQIERIRAALGLPDLEEDRPDPVAGIAAELERVACSRCRRPDRRGCRGCRATIRLQAEAVAKQISQFECKR